jgi:hypothetical protein
MTKQMQPGDDPADFSAPAVQAHLAEADAEETARVLAAEAEGKDRDSVTSKFVTLVVVAPFNTTDVQFETADGGTLVIDRSGTNGPADDADDLVNRAAALGVFLDRKDN